MKQEDSRIIIEKDGDIYVAFVASIPGVIVQTESMENIPKELAKSFEALFRYNIKKGNYQLHKWEHKL